MLKLLRPWDIIYPVKSGSKNECVDDQINQNNVIILTLSMKLNHMNKNLQMTVSQAKAYKANIVPLEMNHSIYNKEKIFTINR